MAPQSSTASVTPQNYISAHFLRVFAVLASTALVEMLIWPQYQSQKHNTSDWPSDGICAAGHYTLDPFFGGFHVTVPALSS